MKEIRRRSLPDGWYPLDREGCESQIKEYIKSAEKERLKGEYKTGGVVPHAGWFYSGDIATKVIYSLKESKPELIVIYGGHLSNVDAPYIVSDDLWETPLGEINIENNLVKEIQKKVSFKIDRFTDNTIEIQLPIIKYIFNKAKIIPIRLPSSDNAVQIAETIALLLREKNIKFLTIGSSDLTHYGMNYGFVNQGTGLKSVRWVKDVNDKGLIDLALKLDAYGVIRHANTNSSACSAGAIAAVVATAKQLGIKNGNLIGYKTSYDVMPNESFVGYAGIVY